MTTRRFFVLLLGAAVVALLASATFPLGAADGNKDTQTERTDDDAVDQRDEGTSPLHLETSRSRGGGENQRARPGAELRGRKIQGTFVRGNDDKDPRPRQPKSDVFDRFDDRQSPLQKGMVDARDHNWRKRVKLGSDPRCSRVVREFAKGFEEPDPKHPKLCYDSEGEEISRDDCVVQYCCEGNDPGTCEEFQCADALIEGGDPAACFDKSGPPDECVSEIFGKKAGNPRVVRCLEDPFDSEGEIKQSCKNVFRECPDLPMVRHEKDEDRSGTITDGKSGRPIGKRIQTRTVIRYDSTRQRGKADAKSGEELLWDAIQIRDSIPETQREAVPGDDRHVDSMLSAGSFNTGCDPRFRCPENDDGDCIDRAADDPDDPYEPYGEDLCFDDNDELVKTLAFINGGCALGDKTVVCCRHVGIDGSGGTGEIFYEDDCLIDPAAGETEDNLRTTLVQMIDEDPFDSLNNDGDCTNGVIVTSDCLTDAGDLHDGFSWNTDEEGACAGLNIDNDCMASEGRIGVLTGGTCVHYALTESDSGPPTVQMITVGETKDEDFIELIDEDCAEFAGDEDFLDNDGDGVAGEDPPGIKTDKVWLAGTQAAEQAACAQFYDQVGQQAGVTLVPEGDELPDGERGCDMSRATRVHVNWKLQQNAEQFDKFKQKTKKEKVFHTDSHGRWCGEPGVDCDADEAKGGVAHPGNDHDPRGHGNQGNSFKHEDRRVIVDEVFAVKCKPVRDKQTKEWIDTYYDDDSGSCVRVDAGNTTRWLKALPVEDDGECTSDACLNAMMGFTFAPPVLEWGWRVDEEICIFGFCFEIFYARIGYEFDLAAGVRLPVEVDFDGIPESVLATQQTPEIETTLQPMDFDVDQFQAFCDAHDLDDPWYIANCERFAFPDFLDDRDGDEFVAHYSIFAGIIVRILMIPIINFGVDSAVDVPAMCTMWKMKDGIEGISLADLVKLELGLLQDGDVLQTLKDNLGNCGSFTTPFGYETCDPLEIGCPLNGERLRAWPFLSLSKWIRADCFDAMRNGEYVTIKGKKIPICTGLILGTSGCSLGVGLGVEATAGSLLIDTDWSAYGDAADPGGELEYERSADDPESEPQIIPPVIVDNYTEMVDGAYQDDAIIGLDDFTYFLNAIEITLSAKLEFGGILSPIPDIASFPIYSFVFDTRQLGWDGIPIPQHPDSEPMEIAIPVENYGLAVDVLPDQSVEVEPGCGEEEPCPGYDVWVTNIGSRPDSFDNFGYELSNRQVIAGCPNEFLIDANNDHDCYGTDGAWHQEDPFDGVPDSCFDECGHPLAGTSEEIGEDPDGCRDPANPCERMADRDDDGDGFADEDGPGDDWSAAWYLQALEIPEPTVDGVDAHTEAAEPVVIRVRPLSHPFTSPGTYPFRVTADSVGSKANGLPQRDPLNNYRTGSPDEALLEVIAFFDPQIQVVPGAVQLTPGIAQSYAVEVRNGSNVEDSIDVTTEFLDFNRAGCDLVTLGLDPGCPYRAVPTVVPAAWLVGSPPNGFGPLLPSQFDLDDFGIDVPGNWAGMTDTVYRFESTAYSQAGPPANNSFVAEHTVQATLESRTRYIGLEIEALIGAIEQANADGIRTAGLHPIATHPVQQANQRALDQILAGNPSGGAKGLETCIHTTEAFIRALDGSGGNGKIPEPYFSDFRRRAEAIVADLNSAVAGGPQPAAEAIPLMEDLPEKWKR